MRPAKLAQHMKANADRMAEGLMQKIRGSDRCGDLVLKVPEDEHKRYSLEIYQDLTDWLANETDSIIEGRYIAAGARRAQQGVPLSNMFWAACITRDHLWDYIQQECLLDEQVDFWGGVILLRSLNQFFDRAMYWALVGYQKAGKETVAGAPAVSA